MGRASIPVDLFNPGQVFACLGLLEATEILQGNARGGFEWNNGTDRFHLSSAGSDNPVKVVLQFLEKAKVVAIIPCESNLQIDEEKVDEVRKIKQGTPLPYPVPLSPATLPAYLENNGRTIQLDYWGDTTIRDNVKFWAGNLKGALLTKSSLNLVQDGIEKAINCPDIDPFALSAPQTSSFRFDWRRDCVPSDVGFIPDKHSPKNTKINIIEIMGFPLIEILAAIGMSHSRPRQKERLTYSYSVVGKSAPNFLDPIFLRAALGCSILPFQQRFFRMHLGLPGGEENPQARCVINVTEEPHHEH